MVGISILLSVCVSAPLCTCTCAVTEALAEEEEINLSDSSSLVQSCL